MAADAGLIPAKKTWSLWLALEEAQILRSELNPLTPQDSSIYK
jgi:hypothetical protein